MRNLLYRVKKDHSSNLAFPDVIIILAQIILYIVIVIPLRVRYRARRSLPGNIYTLKKGSLILSNHQSMVDPFFITISLPFFVYLRILPLRFPTAEAIYSNPFYNPKFFPLLKMFGCFSIGKNPQEMTACIFYMRDLLIKKHTLFLFPEGKIVSEKTIGEFRKGVSFFVRDCANVMFVRLRGFNNKRRLYYPGGEHSITFGRVMQPDVKMTTEEMRNYLINM